MIKQYNNTRAFSLRKVLVTSIYGHEDMIDYLSIYRTQDKFKGEKFYVKGALCWFETDQYGDPIGSVYFIKRIPDQEILKTRYKRNLKTFTDKLEKKPTLKENWIRRRADTELWTYEKKRFAQINRKDELKHGGQKGNRRRKGNRTKT